MFLPKSVPETVETARKHLALFQDEGYSLLASPATLGWKEWVHKLYVPAVWLHVTTPCDTYRVLYFQVLVRGACDLKELIRDTTAEEIREGAQWHQGVDLTFYWESLSESGQWLNALAHDMETLTAGFNNREKVNFAKVLMETFVAFLQQLLEVEPLNQSMVHERLKRNGNFQNILKTRFPEDDEAQQDWLEKVLRQLFPA